jgi:hypothetical protein
MVTGFFPEPNYLLAATATLGFGILAVCSYLVSGWTAMAPLSLGIVASSIWFHTQKTQLSYWVDQGTILLWLANAFKEAVSKGVIATGLAILAALYNILVFFVGWMGSTYGFSPNRKISTLFHASTHLFSVGIATILLPL